MPIIKSAKKAARQAIKRTEHNVEIKKAIKAGQQVAGAQIIINTTIKID